jgi:anthranilate synthase/aminodeoxychorismate synthase-like glutamine amidotransferase
MRVLFVENHDSFSWNLIDRLPVSRAGIDVVDGRETERVLSALGSAGLVVVGPGPMDPERAGLVGVVRRAAALRKPLLGVCLGHQALGMAFGATLRRETPCHGKREEISFAPSRLFSGLSGRKTVMRYHSLVVDDAPPELHVVARTDGGLVMALEHAELPMAGLQFHPDSFGTSDGEEMLAAFFRSVS